VGYRYNAITGEVDRVDTTTVPTDYLNQIDADVGSATPVAHIVNLLGTAAQGISSSAAGNTVTLTISDATETQKGVSELATNAESIAGTDSARTIVPTALKAKLGLQTANAIAYGAGDSSAIAWSAALTDGQIMIGATGAAPTAGSLSSTGGTVTITAGANTINLEAGAGVPTSFVTDAGTATPALNILNVLGGNNIGTVGAGNSVTVNVTGTTASCVQVGNGTGSLTSIGAGTTGELLIGATGGDPAFGSLAYGSFSFANIAVANPVTLSIANTDTTASSTAALQISVPPLGADGMVTWEVQGTLFYAAGVDNTDSDIWKLTNSSDPSTGTAAIAVDHTTVAVTFAEAYEFPVADGNASEVLITDGAGNVDWGAVGSILIDHDNILYVGKHGNDANDGMTPNNAKLTIQAAVTAAAAGDTIWVYPGTYTETITHAANNVTVIGVGKPNTCIITQADANVIDFSTYTGIQYKYFKISCSAATSAIWTIQGTTGSCAFKECHLEMTTATDVAAANQAGVARVTGAGTITVILGKVYYYHTGNGGATAQKAAFSVANGGLVELILIEDLTISNSGTALASAVGIDLATTGIFHIHDCQIDVTDPNATVLAGLAYVGGTGTDHEYFRNNVNVTATNNVGYGFYSDDTATSSRFFYNHIHVTDVAGTSYSFHIGNTATVISQFDDIVAADGENLVGGGTFTLVSSESDGDLTLSGSLYIPTSTATEGVVFQNDKRFLSSYGTGNVFLGSEAGNFTLSGGNYNIGIGDAALQDVSSGDHNIGIGYNALNGLSTAGQNVAIGTSSLLVCNNHYNVAVGYETLKASNGDGNVAIGHKAMSAGTGDWNVVIGKDTGLAFSSAEQSVGIGGACLNKVTSGKYNTCMGYQSLVHLTTGSFNICIGRSSGSQYNGAQSNNICIGNVGVVTDSAYVRIGAVGTHTKTFLSGAVTFNAAFEFPTADGNAGEVLTTDGAGNVDWQANSSLSWSVVTDAAVSAAVNTGYITNRAGGVTLTLPATPAVGSIIRICGIQGNWVLAQNAIDTVYYGNQTTTPGAGGSLTATDDNDCIELVCTAYSAGVSADWSVLSSIGNITVT